MSFGSKNKYDDKALNSLKPTSFYTPFGSLSKGRYTPVESADQVATRNMTNSKIKDIISGLPTQYDVNAAYNNPFYNTTLNLAYQPINQQRAQDTRELNNQLSARNQMGSSYDAYSRYLMDQRYDQSYRQAENQARLNSADAYNQSIQNSLNSLQGLRNDMSSYMNTLYKPAELALGYQQAVAPLQNATASYYGNLSNREYQQQQKTQEMIGQALQLALMMV